MTKTVSKVESAAGLSNRVHVVVTFREWATDAWPRWWTDLRGSPEVAPLLRRQSDGGTDRHQAEVSYWAVGIVKIDFGDSSLGLPTASVDVRGLQVEGRGNIDVDCEPITVGSFIT